MTTKMHLAEPDLRGGSRVCIDIERAADTMRRVDAMTPGAPRIAYLAGRQCNGHEAGDRALVAATEAIKASIRSSGLCARRCGWKFLVLSPGLDRKGTVSLAEKLRGLMEHSVVTVAGVSIVVAASIGICLVAPGETPDRAVARADRALCRAKTEGRNQWVLEQPK